MTGVARGLVERRLWHLVFALGALAGCPSAHHSDDASVGDTAPDVSSPDVPTACPDRDGDGATDATCGGTDCDDTDGELGPTRGRCSTPTERVECLDGAVTTRACPSVCDARTGTCADEVCGDGVLHDGEDCDDGNDAEGDGCDSECVFPMCISSADCPADAPSCSELTPDGTSFRCRPEQVGGALFDECSVDSQCESGFCDLGQNRCSVGCASDANCPAAEGWCFEPTELVMRREQPARCAIGCSADSECSAARFCTAPIVLGEDGGPRELTMCQPALGRGLPGDDVDDWFGFDCLNGLASVIFEPERHGRCSSACVSDDDCHDAALPFCSSRFMSVRPRDPGWRIPVFRICQHFRRESS
jgi:cysteine-rich repeat protein